MNLRIIVTGKNRKIANDVCEHLGADRGDYTLYKCAASKTALFDMALSERPHAIIICTGNETKDTVKVFDILKESSKAGYTAVIVIANDEDRKIFIDETNLAKITFLERPVSLWALYSKLDEVEKKAEKEEEQSTLGVEEFVNENAVEVFERKHILVVDDDPEALMMIKEHLREFYEVTLVNGCKNMIKALTKYKVDLILLDYMMPEMDGPEVLQLLRTFPDHKDIPVVFLTGMSDKDAVVKTLVELKPQGYVLKPATKSELVAKIIDVLG